MQQVERLIEEYVENNIVLFHEKRVKTVENLNIDKVLQRKNPYLFRAKNLESASDLVKKLIDASLSSSEEAVFGDFLEGLAIFINEKKFNGRKSGIEGIDLEFDYSGIRYIVSIKSGPNWGNASQIKKMKESFIKATKTLRTSNAKIIVKAINGCCYGKKNVDHGDYELICGEKFWAFISGIDDLYKTLILPLGHEAKKHNDNYVNSLQKIENKMIAEFIGKYCFQNGAINWEKIVETNSKAKLK